MTDDLSRRYPPPPRKRSLLLSPLVFVWRTLGWLRAALLNLITLAILVAVVLALVAHHQKPALPGQAPLLLNLAGTLVDQYAYTSPQEYLNPNWQQRSETRVQDLVDLLAHASDNPRITGLVLQLDYFEGGGLSKMQEVGRALDAFRAKGKPIIAIADYYTQQQYFLASYADEIHLHDMGGVLLTGFGLYRNYLKAALDKLSVELHVFKAGDFKDFGEPYTRNDMSDESREHNREWLEALWQVYTQNVEHRRQLPEGSLHDLIANLGNRLAEYQGDTAALALQAGLIDHLGSREQIEQRLIDRFGQHPDIPGQVSHITDWDYWQQLIPLQAPKSDRIALIVAQGTILDGHHPEGTIGGETLRDLIRTARDDPQTRALVLRIDSGGGSAFASEIIRQELQLTRERGLPVVVSMGSVAASGGYWIAMGADEIWATPTTITGSIGVFGLVPTLDKSLAKLGIHTDGLGTTPLAGALRPDLPMAPETAYLVQSGIDQVYRRFLTLVARQRNTTTDAINAVAQGRVWTGARAQELGLVDQLGDLNDAIASAARQASLDSYDLVLIEREKTPTEQLLQRMMESSSLRSATQHLLRDWSGLDARWLDHLRHLSQQLPIQQTTPGAPRPVYALCLSCAAL